jgi:hypothetical protein
MSAHVDFVKNNARYAESFDKGALELPAAKNCIVGMKHYPSLVLNTDNTLVTCMDARVE